MATKKKMLQAAAGNAGGAGLDITEVFSTYLYDGTGSAQTITNNIDLAGEGGIVWLKSRSDATPHTLHTTDIGALNYLVPNNTSGNNAGLAGYGLTAFNSNGFSLGTDYEGENGSGKTYSSWTARKAEKFFDVVTYTGNGSVRTIPHGLNCAVGSIFIKRLDNNNPWIIFHRSNGATVWMSFDTAASGGNSGAFNNTMPTDSVFTLGTRDDVNNNGNTYVAYLFAHNDGDGGFGPDGDADIIKCGSYTGNGSSNGPVIDLGFEPQWLMIKRTDGTSSWQIVDSMRGMPVGGDDAVLHADQTYQEAALKWNIVSPTSTGFQIVNAGAVVNQSGGNFIYMAIRRGPLAPPEAGTEVFAVHKETSATLNQTPPFLQPAPFAVDFISNKMFGGGSSWWSATRLTDARMQFNQTNAETSVSTTHEFDHNDGVAVNGLSGSTNFMGYMWKRAPGYFDCVAYSGNSTAGRTVSHNVLGVAPEMIWVKSRNAFENWAVYHKGLNGGTTPENYYLNLDTTAAENTQVGYWNNTAPTASNFTVGTNPRLNDSAGTYIAYLFASLDGVSKVGSYTGSNSVAVEVNCGFTSGARFVIIKRTDDIGDWYLYDSVRGIVSSADDPYLLLNTSDAEASNTNNIEPLSSGFKLTIQGTNPISVNGGSYIFYAIA